MLLSDVKKRLDLAKLVSPNSRNIFLEFLDTPLYSQFSRLADNEVDRSLEYSRTFLDAIDQSEVKYLSRLLAILAISRLPKLPDFVVYPHDPHGLSDLSLYFVIRYFNVNIFSFRWIQDSTYSVVFKNIHDNLDNAFSFSHVDMLLENISPCSGLALDWYKSSVDKVFNGNWDYVDFAYKAIAPRLLQGRTYKPRNSYSISPNFKFNKYIQLIKRWVRIRSGPGSLRHAIYSHLLRILNFSFSRYSSQYLPPDFQSISSLSEFVYVPLHFQPENTTSCFGGVYNNQLLFLRKVRSLVGPSLPIVVKDNPLNSTDLAYSRPYNYSFYVKAMVDNVVFAPIDCDSRELISRSIFTFSVNGTACFESSILGVPCVFGGRSMFSSMSNCTHIDFFDANHSFSEWLASLPPRDSSSSDHGISFFLDRDNCIFPCVAYPNIHAGSDFKSAFASMSVVASS